jgi:hypothetical protein
VACLLPVRPPRPGRAPLHNTALGAPARGISAVALSSSGSLAMFAAMTGLVLIRVAAGLYPHSVSATARSLGKLVPW